MNILSTILDRLNQRIEVGNIFDQIYGLSELVGEGNDKAWAHYIGNGQAIPVTNFDAKQGTLFWAKRGKITVNKNETLRLAGCRSIYETRFTLTAYAMVRKSHLPCDSADAQDWVASRVLRLISGTDPQFKTAIGAIAYEVVPSGYATEARYLPVNYEWAAVAIDVDVNVSTSSEDGCYDTCQTGDIPLPDFEPCEPCLTSVAVDGVTITGNGTPADPLVAIGGGGEDLQQTTDIGNSTTNDIDFIGTAGLTFDNGARFRKGTTDAGLGGAKGTAQICSISYELKWEAGRLYYMEQDGFTIREVTHNFNNVPQPTDDSSKGFVVGSRWSLDDGTVYLCSDATIGAAVWAVVSGTGVTAVTATTPLASTGGATPDISISQAGAASDGYLSSTDWNTFDGKQDTLTAGTGISITGTTIDNTAPDQTVGLTAGTGISVSGTYPNFTIDNTAPSSGGTVTSVAATVPNPTNPAFSVNVPNPTTTPSVDITANGLVSQYVRGDGSLANFPGSTGGGASVSYYLNGSINQGTFGGNTYYQMNRTPVIGLGTNFTRTNAQGNGYIAQFLTDAGDPNLLNIPGGNWNFETYLSASSGGGNPSFYIELYKFDGSTFTLIASGAPEGITGGTAIDLYTSAIAVPQTTLLATDRLAVRIFVTTSGRNITLHTEDNNLCQVITTFTTGLTALNGLTDQVQSFATGTTGTDFGITSAAAVHTFNLPTASATNRGALSSSDWSTFNGKFNTPTGTTSQYVRGDGSLATFPTIPSGTVTSVGLTMPAAFSVANSPVTGAGTLAVTGAGTTAQYIRGDGTLATLPAAPTIFKSTTDGTGITGVASEQISSSQLITGGTFAAGDIIRINWRVTKTGTLSAITVKLYVNTTNSLVGAIQVAQNLPGFTNSNSNGYERHLIIKSATNTQTISSASAFTDYFTSTAFVTSNIDWSVNQYIIFMCQLNSASADTVRTSFYLIEKI